MTEFVQPAPTLQRDHLGRPLVVPPDGGKPVAYTRCTTFVDALEDTFHLSKWRQRMTALGLSERSDLRLAVSAHRDDKRELNRICEQALEAAKGSAAATVGTALHQLTEQMDRGQEIPDDLDPNVRASLDAYRSATSTMRHLHIETFMVHDGLQIGGTPDRVSEYRGRQYIVDLKTGSNLDFGAGKIAQQLAVYAHSDLYDIATGERTPFDVDLERAVVVWLPADQPGKCELMWVDIAAGWEAVQLSARVRAYRTWAKKSALQPIPAA